MKGDLAQTAAQDGYDKAIQEMTLAELNNYTEYKVGIAVHIIVKFKTVSATSTIKENSTNI